MHAPSPQDRAAPGRRSLSYAGFAAIVVVYLVILQGGGLLAQHLFDAGEEFVTTKDVFVGLWIPVGTALLFTYGMIAWLGWMRPVLHDDRPVQRWVYVVPIVFAVAIAIAIDYADLLDKDVGFILALLVATQFVGWGEEGMFRGIGVTVLRDHALTEGRVALISSLIFGSVHLTNIISRGTGAISQALIVSVAGYFFYLTRRVSGGNALNSVIHGLFDFSIITGTAILVDQEQYVGSIAAILTYFVISIILIVRRRKIELEPAAAGATS